MHTSTVRVWRVQGFVPPILTHRNSPLFASHCCMSALTANRVTCRGLVLLNWSGSKRECSIIISYRGDLDRTGGCSQVVRLFSTVQGQIP